MLFMDTSSKKPRSVEKQSEGELEKKMSVTSSVGIQNQSLHNIFVYGSLLADEVVQVLLKRVPSSAPATLPAHDRFSIKGRVYPAILPVEDKKVTGRVCNIPDIINVISLVAP